MEKLCIAIRELQERLPELRKQHLKELPTRVNVIDPILEALGWNVRNLDEVHHEYTTADGRSVDYALFVDGRPELFIEAKPLGDSLDDIKTVCQIDSYASNAGVAWCVLTNGVRWRVYRSTERCPAEEKLMFEVDLDSNADEVSVEQLAKQLGRLSRTSLAERRLDEEAEIVFTDKRVRTALDQMMQSPPRGVVNAIRTLIGEYAPTSRQIERSLQRIWKDISPIRQPHSAPKHEIGVSEVRRRKTEDRQGPSDYTESLHTKGKPQEVIELYRAIDRYCLSLEPGEVVREYKKMTVNYKVDGCIFCSVRLLMGGLRVWLKLNYHALRNPPVYARDVSNVGHYGTGDLELALASLPLDDEVRSLLRQSFEAVVGSSTN